MSKQLRCFLFENCKAPFPSPPLLLKEGEGGPSASLKEIPQKAWLQEKKTLPDKEEKNET